MLTLGAWFVTTLAVLFTLVCVFFILLILIQKPRGGGLSGAFGGGGGSANAVFGAKTGDVLTWITSGMFAVFLLLAIALVFATRQDSQTLTTVEEQALTPLTPLEEGQAPEGSAAPEVPLSGTPEAPADEAPAPIQAPAETE